MCQCRHRLRSAPGPAPDTESFHYAAARPTVVAAEVITDSLESYFACLDSLCFVSSRSAILLAHAFSPGALKLLPAGLFQLFRFGLVQLVFDSPQVWSS